MLDIVLLEPEIPHNTGAIARTCAVTGARLHLIEPLGFEISDRWVKRCGLDYWPLVELRVYESFESYREQNGDALLYLASTKAPRAYHEADFRQGAALLFGKETAGLPRELLERYRERCLRIPMRAAARSLNLSNAVAILAYEVLRQQGFQDLEPAGAMAEGPLDM